MADGFFGLIFESSMRASLLILTVLILKTLLGHKVNNKWHTVIWVVVAIRLIIPWAPQSPFSLFNAVKPAEKAVKQVLTERNDLFNTDSDVTYGKTKVHENAASKDDIQQTTEVAELNDVDTASDYHVNNISGINVSGPKHIKPAEKTGLLGYLTWIWLSGELIFILLFLVLNLLLRTRIKCGAKLDNSRINQIMENCRAAAKIGRKVMIYEADGINSPMLYGIWQPIIVLPQGMADTMSDTELGHIILHEMMHLKKRDNVRWIAVLSIRAIHWFNPLVHLAAADYKRSNERYCDSMVLELLNEDENTGYGRTLVRLARGYRRDFPGLSSAINGGPGSLEKRIKNIARHTKGACRWTITAVIVLALAACAGLSNEVDTPEFMSNLTPEEIHFYFQSEPLQKNEVENMLNEVSLRLSDNLKVTPVFHWLDTNTYDDEIVKLINSGERIDAFTSSFITYGGHSFENRDELMDLTDLFREYAPDYYSELTSHSVGIEKLKNCTQDGKLICVPNNDLLTERAFIVVRKDLAEMFAPDGFETLEDYGNFLAKIKEYNTLLLPGIINPWNYFDTYLQGNGYFEYNTACFYKKWDPAYRDECYPMERTDRFASAYSMLKEWHHKDYIEFDRGTGDTSSWLSMGGLVSVLIKGSDIDKALSSISSEYEFIADPLYMEEPHSALIVTRGISVSKSCTCPERVMMFLEWIHSSQVVYDLFVYGVEYRNYTLKDDRISFVSDELDIQSMNYEFFPDFFRDFRYDRLNEYQPDDYKKVYRDAYLENIVTSEEIFEKVMGIPAEGIDRFFDDREAVQDFLNDLNKSEIILQKYMGNINQIMREIYSGLFLKEPERIIQMQNETGIDEWLDVVNGIYKDVREKY